MRYKITITDGSTEAQYIVPTIENALIEVSKLAAKYEGRDYSISLRGMHE